MGFQVTIVASLMMFGAYTFLFKEDFTKELLDKVLIAAVVIGVIILLSTLL